VSLKSRGIPLKIIPEDTWVSHLEAAAEYAIFYSGNMTVCPKKTSPEFTAV